MGLAETAWVDKAMTTAWPRILRASPRSSWMPLHATSARGKISPEELGCGHYGCVMPTSDPNVVCKITSDPTEATFIAAALSLRELPEGIVVYHEIFAIPDGSHRGRPTFVLWREAATDVGMNVHAWSRGDDYFRRSYEQLGRHLDSFRQAAGELRKVLKSTKRNPFELIEEAKQYDSWAWDIVAGYDLDRVQRPMTEVRGSAPQKVALGLRYCIALAETMENTYLCDAIGRALAFYLEHGLLLADVHIDNIGLVRRLDRTPVITDPGHAVALLPKWTKTPIKALP